VGASTNSGPSDFFGRRLWSLLFGTGPGIADHLLQHPHALAQVAPQVRTSRSTEIFNPVFEMLCAPYSEAQ
jgi:hypothetical protein